MAAIIRLPTENVTSILIVFYGYKEVTDEPVIRSVQRYVWRHSKIEQY